MPDSVKMLEALRVLKAMVRDLDNCNVGVAEFVSNAEILLEEVLAADEA